MKAPLAESSRTVSGKEAGQRHDGYKKKRTSTHDVKFFSQFHFFSSVFLKKAAGMSAPLAAIRGCQWYGVYAGEQLCFSPSVNVSLFRGQDTLGS